MPNSPLRFLSGNKHKLKEAQQILGRVGFDVVSISYRIEEIQSSDAHHIVRDKVLKAFAYSGRPLIVEHTGLYMDALNGFPGGLTQVFWNALQADRFAELFGSGPTNRLTARTFVGYTDGKQIEVFEGEVAGHVPPEPRGDRAFQWDCVFVPEGHDETFAEMGALKNEISMRRKALDHLASFLEEHGP